MCFGIASENAFHIASDLGVCDSNRIAHRGCIARFGPLSWAYFTASVAVLRSGSQAESYWTFHKPVQ